MFVGVHGVHEFDFVGGVFPLAGGRVNLAAALDLAAFSSDRLLALAAFTFLPLNVPAFHFHFHFLCFGHGRPLFFFLFFLAFDGLPEDYFRPAPVTGER